MVSLRSGPVHRLSNHKSLLILLALLVLFYSQMPLGTALVFGEDEGCELMKALMCNKGFHLYKDIWNDQPPLFTLILSQAFNCFGTSLLVGRLVAAGFGLLLFSTFYLLVEQRLGQWKALLAAFFLLASPDVTTLCVSAMLEVPTFATALLSACFLFQWTRRPHPGWLIASGAIMGIALQIKLTSALVMPAMLVEIALARKPERGKPWWKATFVDMFEWGTVALITCGAIIALWARGSIQSSWKSHFEEHPPAGMIGPSDFPFHGALVWNHIDCVVAAIVGIALVFMRRSWRQSAFPLTLLLVVSAVHSIHRPWWDYYYLHLALPLAWLAALAVSDAVVKAAQLLSSSGYRFSTIKTWKGVSLCALAALVLFCSEGRLESSAKDLRAHQSAANDPIVLRMKQFAGQTHWVYADQDIYPFAAGLCVPPELTVVIPKRFWSEQISMTELVETCKRYKVEQLVLPPEKLWEEWKPLLAEYDILYQSTNAILYVSKRLQTTH